MNFFGYLLVIFSVNAMAQQSGSIDREAVRNVVKDNIKLFQQCYAAELKNDPIIAGKVVLNWDITDTGTVTIANVKSSTLKNYKVEECMVNTIKSLKFPKSPKGMISNINYPFVFGKAK